MLESVATVNQSTNHFHELLNWSSRSKNFALFNRNGFTNTQSGSVNFEMLAGSGTADELEVRGNIFKNLDKFISDNKGKWIFGFLNYDLKNEIEKLTSNNFDALDFPQLHFFVPEKIFLVDENGLQIIEQRKNPIAEKIISHENISAVISVSRKPIALNQRISKTQYLQKVNKIKNHIQQGDVYELNLCQEFYAEDAEINPEEIYQKLNKISPAPFSCFYKTNDKYLISSSPERFLCRHGSKLYSQPMKGTAKRSLIFAEDEKLKAELLQSEKERAENVMIVDLVRNDLSRVAERGTVTVEELFGIYSFAPVHQMVSTVGCEVKKEKTFSDIIKATFPMGSMTGAPKVRAMQLIEEAEETKRGLFSGSAGYIAPNGDFDFNVVIRSILYNQTKKYLSLQVGSAITSLSDAEQEYEECLLKSEALQKALIT